METAKQDKENHVLFGLGESVVLFYYLTYDTYNIHFLPAPVDAGLLSAYNVLVECVQV